MSPSRAAAIVLRQIYLLRVSSVRIVPLFAWVAIDIILWGFITRYLNTVSNTEINFVPLFLGAVLLWDFFGRVMHGVSTAFLEDVWSRNFLNVFSSPLRISEYLTGLVVTSVATSFVGLATMLALSSSIFGLSFFSYGAMFVPFLMILFMFGIALGILGSALVLRFGPASEWFIWPMPALVSPFAGVFYPISTLPPWMQGVSKLLPPSYVFEGMRGILAGRPASAALLTLGFTMAAGYIVVACAVFSRVHRGAVRSGLLARYSAEGAS